MKSLGITLAAAFIAVLGTDAYVTSKHEAQLTTAQVQAYTAGREQAIEDLKHSTSAPTAELCTAWWFGSNNKQQAMTQACKSFNTPHKVASK